MSAVMVICHELLPTSCLLVLAPTTSSAETTLAAHLAQACRSGKPAVWVDCRLLTTLSSTAAWLLWACQQCLQRRRARLVLCQVAPTVEHTLQQVLAGTENQLYLVPTLDDASALN